MAVNAVTPADDWHSVAIPSDGSYGVEKGLICSFPTRSDGTKASIVQGLSLSEFGKSKLQQTVNELLEEKSMVADLLPN
jgi:malate dehydrogenase